MEEDIYKPWIDFRNQGPITTWGLNEDDQG